VSRVAIATARGADDPDDPLLFRALADADIDADLAIWDDDAVRWDDYDLVVVRSTWDYPVRRDDFLAWAHTIARLENPWSVLQYSSDKIYLADVEAHGLSIIPSHFAGVGETPEFFAGDFVVKPRVGAGSNDAMRYREGEEEAATRHVEALHARGRDVLIQPYIHSVDTLGERALVFIDGQYSHAITKGAMLNVPPDERDFLYRREQIMSVTAENDAVRTATNVLATLGFDSLLYARVDLVATIRGWLVMEIELVEPSLFLTYHEATATALARSIARRLRH
jgi:glutathione synthase/RimK-type ligase-like ATP-grasp enzyme